MPCLSFSELIDQKKQFENQKISAHLQTCPKCREKIENLKNLQSFLQENNSPKFEKNTERCYDDSQLVSFIEKRKKSRSTNDFYIHLSQCDSCLNRHVALENMLHEFKKEGLIPKQSGSLDKIYDTLLLITHSAKEKFRAIWSILSAPGPVYRWSGFAVIVIAAGLLLFKPFQNQESPFITRESKLENQIKLIEPQNRTTIFNITELEFKWSEIENITSYNLTLLDSDGTIIWEQKTDQTSLNLPQKVKLETAKTYFWQIEAVFDFNKFILSELTSFTYINK